MCLSTVLSSSSLIYHLCVSICLKQIRPKEVSRARKKLENPSCGLVASIVCLYPAWLELPENNLEPVCPQVSVTTAQRESGGLLVLLTTTAPRKGLLLSCGLVAGQQLSGINVVIFYSETIFLETGSKLSPAICSIVVAVILILSAGAAPPLVNRFGMKGLLIVSAAGMGFFQVKGV